MSSEFFSTLITARRASVKRQAAVRIIALIGCVIAGPFAHAAEISTNGIGGGPWSNPATWSGKVVPGPGDDVVIRKFDVVTFDKNDADKASCRKLQIDPRGVMSFKTGAGKQVCSVADAIENYGVIKLDGTKSASDFLELRMIGETAEKRKITLNKGSAFLLYGKANLPENRRNIAVNSPKLPDQKDDLLCLVAADGGVSVDWQRAQLPNVKIYAQKLDNTGAKVNERLNIIENQFTGLGRVVMHTCDTPVISKNSFDYQDKATMAEAGITVIAAPLAEIKGNTVRGAYAHGIYLSSQSDIVLENNLIEKCDIGLYGYAIPNIAMKKCIIRGCGAGIKIEAASGVIEDTLIDGATNALNHQNATLQFTNFQIKDLAPKGQAVLFEGGTMTLLNCNITPAQIKFGTQPATAKDTPITCLQYAIVSVKGAPADALVELRTSIPALPADATDPNVRNSPAPLTAGLSPLPKTLNPLIVKAWTMDLKGKLQPGPEYNVKVLGPAAKEGAPRPLLKAMTYRPQENVFRANPDDAMPSLEVLLK